MKERKKRSRLLALLLAFVMVFSVMPVNAFATETTDSTETVISTNSGDPEKNNAVADSISITGLQTYGAFKSGDNEWTMYVPYDADQNAELAIAVTARGYNDTLNGVTVNSKDCVLEGEQYTCKVVPDWVHGIATLTVKVMGNRYSTSYTIYMKVADETNKAPTLSVENDSITEETITYGSYNLDLSSVFSDDDSEDLYYFVEIDGKKTQVSAEFSESFDKPGVYNFIFTASDGIEETRNNYSVEVTVEDGYAIETGHNEALQGYIFAPKLFVGGADIMNAIQTGKDPYSVTVLLDESTIDKTKPLTIAAEFIVTKSLFLDSGKILVNGTETGVITKNIGADTTGWWGCNYIPEWNEEGKTTLDVVTKGNVETTYKFEFELIDKGKNNPPVLADAEGLSVETEQYKVFTHDLSTIFTDVDGDTLSYSVAIGEAEPVVCEKDFYYPIAETGDLTLKFTATDGVAVSDPYTVSLKISEYDLPDGYMGIYHTVDTGVLKAVYFTDSKGNVLSVTGKIEEQTSTTAKRSLNVTLPASTPNDETITAHFIVEQNQNEVPVLSSSAGAGAKHDRTILETTLSGGEATSAYIHFHRTVPRNTHDENQRTVYSINYLVSGENNTAPALAEGITPSVTAMAYTGAEYGIDLSPLFVDAQNNRMSYTVKVDEAEEVTANANYSITFDETGTHTLTFKAVDIYGASSEEYVVNLTVVEGKTTDIKTGDAFVEASPVMEAYLSNITVSGPGVKKYNSIEVAAKEMQINILLEEGTPEDTVVTLGFTPVSGHPAPTLVAKVSKSNPAIVKLVDGEIVYEEYAVNFADQNSHKYTIWMKNSNQVPALKEGIQASVTYDFLVNDKYQVNLEDIFTDGDGEALTYYATVGDTTTKVDANYELVLETEGVHVLKFKATDGFEDSVEYTVTLYVTAAVETYDAVVKVPETISPKFYATLKSDEENGDVYGMELSAVSGETADGFTTYTVTVPANVSRISYRGVDADNVSWGGMTIETEKGMAAVTLRQVQAVILTKDSEGNFPTVQQAVFQVKGDDTYYAVNGDPGNDRYGYLYYRFLLIAGDNDRTYTYYAIPCGDWEGKFGVNQSDPTETIGSESAEIVTTTLELGIKSSATITAPEDAKVQMFCQKGNYNVVELKAVSTAINEEDGTQTVTFNTSEIAGSKTFRVSREGEITKAGYLTGDSVTVDWNNDDRGPKYREPYGPDSAIAARADDSILVNVNYRNNLVMDNEETYLLKAYRIWQIINSDTANIMIEPDFHYEVISGDDIIDITPYEERCSGNATNNWFNINAKQEGVAILEVGYDAIDIVGNTDIAFGIGSAVYNAIDPARTALVVVQVGNAATDVEFGIKYVGTHAWDAEHDTVYFFEEKGQVNFEPTVTSGSIAKVEVSGDKGTSWTELKADENGIYTADILSGNNIIRVIKDDGTESYQIIRGDKITYTITEKAEASNQDGIIDAGEKLIIRFNGVHNAVGKMSGINNPMAYVTHYTFMSSEITGAGGQYTYPSEAKVILTVPVGAYVGDSFPITNGYTTHDGYGTGGGGHRNINGEVAPNLDADGIAGSRNIFSDFSITVGDKTADYIDVEVESVTLNEDAAEVEMGGALALSATVNPDNATNKSVTWTSSDETIATVNENGVVTAVEVGEATITATTNNGKTATCVVTVVEQTAVTNVEYQISQIGEVTLEDKEAIEAARRAYDALSDAQKARVDNYETLQNAENALAQLEATKADEDAAKAVDEKIDAIGEVELTEECEKAVTDARAAYDALTSTQKALVENLEILVNAEDKLAKLKEESKIPELDCGLKESEIIGYVTISFVDEGVRVDGESMDDIYKEPLGTIVEKTKVPFKPYDTVAGVTIRVLEALGMRASYSGDANSGFYLSAIGNFEVNGTQYEWFGEFDAGQGSGWMITQNDWFINKGASEFYVEDGDNIEWQYTCQLGEDIGDDRSVAEIQEVEDLIDAIGEVTLESEAAIQAAREAYNELSSIQKEAVANYEVLTAAEARLEELKAEAEEPDEPTTEEPDEPTTEEPDEPTTEEPEPPVEPDVPDEKPDEGKSWWDKLMDKIFGNWWGDDDDSTEEPDEPTTEEPEPPVEPDIPDEKPEENKGWFGKLFDKMFGWIGCLWK